MERRRADWHMDVKVTLGVIVALLLNAAGSVWWASRLDSTVQQHEQKISAIVQTVSSLSQQQGDTKAVLASIQTAQQYQTDMIKDMRDQLNRDQQKKVTP